MLELGKTINSLENASQHDDSNNSSQKEVTQKPATKNVSPNKKKKFAFISVWEHFSGSFLLLVLVG